MRFPVWLEAFFVRAGQGMLRLAPDRSFQVLALRDGVDAPTAVTGIAFLYVDTSDGDLKIRYGDNTTKTIVVDT